METSEPWRDVKAVYSEQTVISGRTSFHIKNLLTAPNPVLMSDVLRTVRVKANTVLTVWHVFTILHSAVQHSSSDFFLCNISWVLWFLIQDFRWKADCVVKKIACFFVFLFLFLPVAPIKALCSQCFENWKMKFGPLGLNCKELTGDTEIDDFFEIQDSHIILTTPVCDVKFHFESQCPNKSNRTRKKTWAVVSLESIMSYFSFSRKNGTAWLENGRITACCSSSGSSSLMRCLSDSLSTLDVFHYDTALNLHTSQIIAFHILCVCTCVFLHLIHWKMLSHVVQW